MQILKKFYLLILFAFTLGIVLNSCKSAVPAKGRAVHRSNPYKIKTENSAENRDLFSHYRGKPSPFTQELLQDAQKYIGAPYKFGGNDSKGFDCSGLMCQIFKENGKILPRNSRDQGASGKEIQIAETRPGDLLFFATGSSGQISHVGVVHTINEDGEVVFLHASSSKGVTLSSLNEKYWNRAYLFARRIEN